MLGIIAVGLLIIAFFEHASDVTVKSHLFDFEGMVTLGLIFLAAHVVRPYFPWRK